MVRVWAFVILILAALGFAAWASDFVTMQGERTVYTVDCSNGSWQANHCAGKLVAGNRYRYRALKPHSEVIFWTVGAKEPSGKFGECTIQDGRNWRCKRVYQPKLKKYSTTPTQKALSKKTMPRAPNIARRSIGRSLRN